MDLLEKEEGDTAEDVATMSWDDEGGDEQIGHPKASKGRND